MTRVTASELGRRLSSILDRLEHGGEEFVVVRNNQPIARILPGNPHRTALEAMADLYRTLAPDAGRDWVADSRLPPTLADETRDPWAS